MIPTLINKARAVATMTRELSANQSKKPFCTFKVKRGTSAGVESTNAMVIAPLMMPTTNAATIASL